MKIYFAVLTLIVIYLVSGCTETVWVQKDFAKITPTIDTISIIFPQIEYVEKNGEKLKAKSGHSYFVSKQVADILKELIDSGKFVSQSANIVFDSTVIIKWMRNNFADSKTVHKQMYDSLQALTGETRIIPAIPELQQLAEKVRTRYFVLVTGYSFGTTETTRRFDMLQQQTFELLYDHAFAYERDWFGLSLQIILVDARSNEVLWYNYNKEKESRYDTLDKEKVKDLCLGLLTANKK